MSLEAYFKWVSWTDKPAKVSQDGSKINGFGPRRMEPTCGGRRLGLWAQMRSLENCAPPHHSWPSSVPHLWLFLRELDVSHILSCEMEKRCTLAPEKKASGPNALLISSIHTSNPEWPVAPLSKQPWTLTGLWWITLLVVTHMKSDCFGILGKWKTLKMEQGTL